MGNEMSATSRVTSQNQVSIPAEVRRRFGIRPGSELVWEERDGHLEVRPKARTLDDVQAVLADRPVASLTLEEIRAAKIARGRARGRR